MMEKFDDSNVFDGANAAEHNVLVFLTTKMQYMWGVV